MIDPRAFRPLALDADFVRAALPHRPPLLLVDAVDALGDSPPALHAHKDVSEAEPVLAGHFPTQPIWPGAYTVEGLAQCCALLGTILAMEVPCHSLAEVPRVSPPADGAVRVLASIDVKLTAPVLPGQRLDYWVVRTHVVEPAHRFEVEATVKGRLVARGTLTTALWEPGR